jgi:hypothetical protein
MPILNKRELDKAIENGLTISTENGNIALSPIEYKEKIVGMVGNYYDRLFYEAVQLNNIEMENKINQIKESDAYQNVTTREGKSILFEEMKEAIIKEYDVKKIAIEVSLNSKRAFVIQRVQNYFPTRIVMYPLAEKNVYGIVTSIDVNESKYDSENIKINIAIPTDEGVVSVNIGDELMNQINNATHENYDTRVYNELYSENKIGRWNELLSMYNNEKQVLEYKKENQKLSVLNKLHGIANSIKMGSYNQSNKSADGALKYVADIINMENVSPVLSKEDMIDVTTLFAPKLKEHIKNVNSIFILQEGDIVTKVYATNDFSGDELIEIYPNYNYLQLTENV